MFYRNLIHGCAFLALATNLFAGNPAPQGVVEGHMKIFPLSDVNLADDATAAKAEPPYSEYPLIIRSREGKKEVTQVTVNRDGNYRVELPPGDYILDVQGSESRSARIKPRPFTVVSNHTVRVDMDIDTGIR